MARATSSFPVPVSPVIRTLVSVGATFLTSDSTLFKAADLPTIPSNMAVSISPRSAKFLPWNLLPYCLGSAKNRATLPMTFLLLYEPPTLIGTLALLTQSGSASRFGQPQLGPWRPLYRVLSPLL